MQIDCPTCRRVLDFAGERPSFCAYCGVPLAEPKAARDQFSRCSAPTRPTRTRSGPALAPVVSLGDGGVPGPAARAPADRPWSRFPEQIAGYRLIRKLGSGGMGTVFEAEDEAQAQRVAIKLIGERLASPRQRPSSGSARRAGWPAR